MDHRWFTGHADKEARKAQLKGYKEAYTELLKFLDQLYKEPCRDYGEPNWELRQIQVNEWNHTLDVLKRETTI